MLKIPPRQGLLALLLAALCLPASAQTPTPTTLSEQDRAKFGHFFEPVLLDPRLTTGRLLDAAMPLTDVTRCNGQEDYGSAVPLEADLPTQQRGGLAPHRSAPTLTAGAWPTGRGCWAPSPTGSIR